MGMGGVTHPVNTGFNAACHIDLGRVLAVRSVAQPRNGTLRVSVTYESQLDRESQGYAF